MCNVEIGIQNAKKSVVYGCKHDHKMVASMTINVNDNETKIAEAHKNCKGHIDVPTHVCDL
jgi:hypothetical protein